MTTREEKYGFTVLPYGQGRRELEYGFMSGESLQIETVSLPGMAPFQILYNPLVMGDWELAVAEAIATMTKTCTRTTAVVGDPITMKATGSSGTPPYTIIFKKDGAELTRFTGVPSGTQKSYVYTAQAGDVGARRFSHDLIDAAGKSCSEYCDVVVSAQPPACDFEVS